MRTTVAITVCFCIFDVASAAPAALSGHAISEMIAGAVVELDTPLGTKIPITYGDDGRMTGQAGALGFYLGAGRDKGKWWVASDMLCQRWEKWFDAETQCMRIKKDGPRIHWASRDGKTGTGTVHLRVAAAPETARAAPKPAGAQPVAPKAANAMVAAAPAKPPRTLVSALPSPAKPGDTSHEVAAGNVEPAPRPMPQFSRLTVPFFLPLEAASIGQVPAPEESPAQRPSEVVAPATVAPAIAEPAPTVAPVVDAGGSAEAKPAGRRATAGAVEPMFKVVNVRSGDALNVREGPSWDHGLVGAIAPGGRGVAMTGACRGQWCPVRHLDLRGWVNRTYLESEDGGVVVYDAGADAHPHDSADAPRGCLTAAAKELLGRIEAKFGPMQLVSTCRPGAMIAGSGKPSRHRDGNAIDFKAGVHKQAVVEWLIANHSQGGTMTYRDMDHIHIDIGPHFVALASAGRDWSSERMGLSGRK